MKILLVHGRLDIPFKDFGQGIPSKDYSNLPAIRKPWSACYDLLKACGHEVDEYIVPVWKITEQLFQDQTFQDYDKIIVPHRQLEQFYNLPWDMLEKMLFLMQTVFPERFTLDKIGWGANLSFLPLDGPVREEDAPFFKSLQERIFSNTSKFDQPKQKVIPAISVRGYKPPRYDVLFVCQLPHDETIRFHSLVSVENALRHTLLQAKEKGWSVLVKGHPINPGSMGSLKEIADQYPEVATWIDDISIHDAIAISDIVAMVNSGVGFEAMLHEKPIFTYGRSEYQNVVNYNKPLDKTPPDVLRYHSFLSDFCNNHTLDTTNQEQFYQNLNSILGC
jgi:hypothetical protein